MSRWLRSVNTLLDQLDGQVGEVVHEKASNKDDDDDDDDEEEDPYFHQEGDRQVDAILAKRGLSTADADKDDADEDDNDNDDDDDDDDDEEEIELLHPQEDSSYATASDGGGDMAALVAPSEDDKSDAADGDTTGAAASTSAENNKADQQEEDEDPQHHKEEPSPSSTKTTETAPPTTPSSAQSANTSDDESHCDNKTDEPKEQNDDNDQDSTETPDSEDNISQKGTTDTLTEKPHEPTISKTSRATTPSSTPPPTPTPPKTNPPASTNTTTNTEAQTITQLQTQIKSLQTSLTQSKQTTKESQRQTRKLRRNLLDLNSELESTEREMSAQRTELERAAARMERDWTLHREELATKELHHAKAVASMRKEQEETVQSLNATHAAQLAEMQTRLQRAEEARAREGGDWQGELSQAVAREQESLKQVIALEDEKATLVSQVSSLQMQLKGVEGRLERVGESGKAAAERERDAEDRLDAALSLHARQLSQRQAREEELERTVADLSAALVVARQREQNRLKAATANTNANEQASKKDGDAALHVKLVAAEEEVEALKAQLSLERQHCSTLHQELRDAARIQSEEAAVALAKQRHYDRRVADMTSDLSRLKAQLKEKEEEAKEGAATTAAALEAERQRRLQQDGKNENDLTGGGAAGSSEVDDLKRQIASLSEQILRQQKKAEGGSSERSALRSRLRAAMARAEVAEKALAAASGDSFVDLESGGASSSSSSSAIRRRGRGGGSSSPTGPNSIRSAMNLQPGRVGEKKEKIGNAIDVLDRWTFETGSFLRHNPLARGLFLIYLMILHLWALFILVFHAHSYEEIHGDFGVGHFGLHSVVQNGGVGSGGQQPLLRGGGAALSGLKQP